MQKALRKMRAEVEARVVRSHQAVAQSRQAVESTRRLVDRTRREIGRLVNGREPDRPEPR